MLDISKVKFDAQGLVPAIIQDAETKQVLMLGYMNHETLRESLEISKIVFWSRSRSERWLKGETSGNFLNLVSASGDCDSDALLFLVQPQGPTCHTGAQSCFEADND